MDCRQRMACLVAEERRGGRHGHVTQLGITGLKKIDLNGGVVMNQRKVFIVKWIELDKRNTRCATIESPFEGRRAGPTILE